MELEQQAYEIPGQQLRWRAAQLQQQGYPFRVQSADGGIYIVIVQHPAGLDPFAYQTRHRPAPAVSAGDILRWAAPLAVVALVVAGLYFLFAAGWGEQSTIAGVPVEIGGMRLDPATGHGIVDDGWPRLPDWLSLPDRWPWQPEQQQAQPDGFRWPWDAAAESVAATAESVAATAASVQGTVTLAAGAVLAVLVLLIVLALVRRGPK